VIGETGIIPESCEIVEKAGHSGCVYLARGNGRCERKNKREKEPGGEGGAAPWARVLSQGDRKITGVLPLRPSESEEESKKLGFK